MDVVGTKIPNFDQPVCSVFKPKLLNGELCYQFDYEDIKDKAKVAVGALYGLTFVMDYNMDRMMEPISTKSETSNKNLNEMKVLKDTEKMGAKIHIGTLEQFTSYGGGYFEMTSVSEVTGTPEYIKLAKEENICQHLESLTDCKARNYLDSGKQRCNCRPFWISFDNKV